MQAWRRGQDAYVTCDTVVGGGNLTKDDLERIGEITGRGPLRSLFLFVHHLTWIDKDGAARNEQRDLTNHIEAGYAMHGTFHGQVLPFLEDLGVPVFIVAGDVGAGSLAVHSYEELGPGVHALTSGMGEHPDVGTYLSVEVSPLGVQFSVRQLGSQLRQPAGVFSVPSERFLFER